MRRCILVLLLAAGCGGNLPTSPPPCTSPATYVPAYQSCPGSFDGLPCVTRVGRQLDESGAPLPTRCTEEDGGSALSYVVAECGECR